MLLPGRMRYELAMLAPAGATCSRMFRHAAAIQAIDKGPLERARRQQPGRRCGQAADSTRHGAEQSAARNAVHAWWWRAGCKTRPGRPSGPWSGLPARASGQPQPTVLPTVHANKHVRLLRRCDPCLQVGQFNLQGCSQKGYIFQRFNQVFFPASQQLFLGPINSLQV